MPLQTCSEMFGIGLLQGLDVCQRGVSVVRLHLTASRRLPTSLGSDRLDGCLKRIRAREQSSLLAGLRATNEQVLLRLTEERRLEREREKEEVRPRPGAQMTNNRLGSCWRQQCLRSQGVWYLNKTWFEISVL